LAADDASLTLTKFNEGGFCRARGDHNWPISFVYNANETNTSTKTLLDLLVTGVTVNTIMFGGKGKNIKGGRAPGKGKGGMGKGGKSSP